MNIAKFKLAFSRTRTKGVHRVASTQAVLVRFGPCRCGLPLASLKENWQECEGLETDWAELLRQVRREGK